MESWDTSESWYVDSVVDRQNKADEFFEEIEKIVRRYELEQVNSDDAMMEIGFAVALMNMRGREDN
jgi:hypothetical protein